MGDVRYFTGETRHPIPAGQILDQAKDENLDVAIVIGYDSEGREYFASSAADGAVTLWLLERCKKALIDKADADQLSDR